MAHGESTYARRAQLNRNHVSVASLYLTDCCDLIWRFDRMAESFLYHSQPRRLKSFIDLRLAYECVLKSAVAYTTAEGVERGDILRILLDRNHRIGVLIEKVPCNFQKQLGLESRWDHLDKLPIDLRYSLDAYDFIDCHEDLYNRTIRDDEWIFGLRDYISNVSDEMGKELDQFSGIVRGCDFDPDELLGVEHNVFRDGRGRRGGKTS